MAFGAVYRSEAAIGRLLVESSGRLRELLDRVRHRAEWSVRVYADPAGHPFCLEWE